VHLLPLLECRIVRPSFYLVREQSQVCHGGPENAPGLSNRTAGWLAKAHRHCRAPPLEPAGLDVIVRREGNVYLPC